MLKAIHSADEVAANSSSCRVGRAEALAFRSRPILRPRIHGARGIPLGERASGAGLAPVCSRKRPATGIVPRLAVKRHGRQASQRRAAVNSGENAS